MSWLIEAVVGWLSAGWQRRFFRSKAETSDKPWRKKARVRREVTLPIQRDEAQVICRAVLSSLGTERTNEDGSLEVITPSNLRSSGTVVRAELTPAASGTLVAVTAWRGAQFFDWGESRRAATRVAEELARGHC